MNVIYQPMWIRWISHSTIAGLFVCICAACGAAGSPIAPEDVGLEAKIREQQQPVGQPTDSGEYPIPLEEEPIYLPSLHPVGTR